jgi:hypothetical protein
MIEFEPRKDELNPYPWYDIKCGTCYSVIATVQIVPDDKPSEPSRAVESEAGNSDMDDLEARAKRRYEENAMAPDTWEQLDEDTRKAWRAQVIIDEKTAQLRPHLVKPGNK